MSADSPSKLSVRLSTGSSTWRELEVNPSEPVPVHCEGFVGTMLFLHRPDPEPQDWLYADHFRGKSRRFEWRVQGRFTTDPGNSIHFGGDVDKDVHIGWTLRMTTGWLLSILEMLSSARGHGFSYSLDLVHGADGHVIRPHLAFPLHAADTLLCTPAGEVPPSLKDAFTDTPLSERLHIRDVLLPGNTQDIFTFVYFSKYVDFQRWEILNFPFGWYSSFNSFIGEGTPLNLLVYRLDPAAKYHTKEHQHSIINMKMSYGPAVFAPLYEEAKSAYDNLCQQTETLTKMHDMTSVKRANRLDCCSSQLIALKRFLLSYVPLQ